MDKLPKGDALKLAGIFLLALIFRIWILNRFIEPPYISACMLHVHVADNILLGKGLAYDERSRFIDPEVFAAKVRSGEKWWKMDGYQHSKIKKEDLRPYRARSPIYTLYMTLCFVLFGDSGPHAGRILQTVFDSTVIFFLFALGRQLFSARAGLFAAFLYAIFFPAAYHSTILMYDSFLSFFIALSSWLFWKARFGAWLPAAACAVALGVGSNFRETCFIAACVFALQWLLTLPIKQALSRSAAMGIIIFSFTLPWRLWNLTHHGKAYFMLPYHGSSLLEAINEQDKENRFGLHDAEGNPLSTNIIAERLLGPGIKLYGPEHNQALLNLALPIVKEHPLWYLKGYSYRVMQNTLNPWSLWTNLAPEPHWVQFKAAGGTFSQYLVHHPAPFFIRIFGKSFEMALFLLFLGSIYFFRARWREVLFLTLTPFAFILSLCLFQAQLRFVLPGKISLFILASGIFLELWDRCKFKFKTASRKL